jgi:alpha-L-fucosidase 2
VSDLIKQIFRDMEVDPGEGGARPCPTLFATHLPFQIDANLGFVAAFTECLMQSHAGVIELLPAVPPELATGSVAGIVARPGIEVSIRWEPDAAGGITLIEATFSAVRAPGHARHRVAWNSREVWIDLSRSAAITLRRNDFTS